MIYCLPTLIPSGSLYCKHEKRKAERNIDINDDVTLTFNINAYL